MNMDVQWNLLYQHLFSINVSDKSGRIEYSVAMGINNRVSDMRFPDKSDVAVHRFVLIFSRSPNLMYGMY